MLQPTTNEITHRLQKLLKHELTREEVSDWAFAFIEHDDSIEVEHLSAWHYLVTVSAAAEKIAPNKYLYSMEDIQGWIEEYGGR